MILWKTGVGVVEDLADHPHPFDRLLGDRVIFGEGSGLAVLKVTKDTCDIADSGRARWAGRAL